MVRPCHRRPQVDRRFRLTERTERPGRVWPNRGTLAVVGLGLRAAAHVTSETLERIERAGLVLFLVADPLTEYWLRGLNPRCRSLHVFYAPQKDRLATYDDIVAHILQCVRSGIHVCFAVYGHPGVFAFPTHEAVRRVRFEGYAAIMLPGISAEDCLFADLGIDPAATGCQSFEATDFLVYDRRFDVRSALVLWQIGIVGQFDAGPAPVRDVKHRLAVLRDVLVEHYGGEHEVTLYEAAGYATIAPRIERVRLRALASLQLSVASTLYVPPKSTSSVNYAMLTKLGIESTFWSSSRAITASSAETSTPMSASAESRASSAPVPNASASRA